MMHLSARGCKEAQIEVEVCTKLVPGMIGNKNEARMMGPLTKVLAMNKETLVHFRPTFLCSFSVFPTGNVSQMDHIIVP